MAQMQPSQQGIGSLGQAPGQAPQQQQPPMPAMQPQQGGGGGVQALVPQLEKLQLPQLLQEFNNPNSRLPKYAILAAMEKRRQSDQAMQAVQGQMAMGQNAQNQQAGTVAEQIAQSAQQMAPLAERQNPERQIQQIRQQIAVATQQGKHDVVGHLLDQLKELEQAEFTGQGQSQEQSYAKGGATATTPVNPYDYVINEYMGMEKPPTDLSREEMDAYTAANALRERQLRAIEARKTLPEGITKAREGLASLAKEDAEAQRKRIADYQAALEADKAAAEQRAGRFGAREFAELASFSTKPGEWIGGFAKNIAGLTQRQDQEKAEALKDYRQGQIAQRVMEDTMRQMRSLEAQRQAALAEKDYDRVNQIETAMFDLEGKQNDAMAALGKSKRDVKSEGIKALRERLEGIAGAQSKKDLGAYYKQIGNAALTKGAGNLSFKQAEQARKILQFAQTQAVKQLKGTPEYEELLVSNPTAAQAKLNAVKRELAAQQWGVTGLTLADLDEALASGVASPDAGVPGAPVVPGASTVNPGLYKITRENK